MKRNLLNSMLILLISLVMVLIFCNFGAAASNWWDKLGEPKYGGTITIPNDRLMPLGNHFDPYNWMALINACYEPLMIHDWALDRKIFSFQYAWVPDEHWVGALAESWEFTDPLTVTFKLRQGVHWQNKPPVNGREFTAEDVQYHYDRLLGTGSGFDKPDMFFGPFAQAFDRVTAVDKYTFKVKFKDPTPVTNFWSLSDLNTMLMEPPEVIKEQGGVKDWKMAIGTGPFMVEDFVQNTSLACKKNPDYWGHDERHPQNQIPYVDTIRVLNITDKATALAALRSGKIDFLNKLNWQQAESLKRTNPEIQQKSLPWGANVVYFRADKGAPMDIRVRKALQLSIDRNALAKSHWGGFADPTPYGVVFPVYPDYCFPYKDWPQSLKDEYSYNPDKAKALLAEAGYPNGFQTTCLTSPDYDIELLEIIKSYFMDIGVDMNIRVEEGSVIRGILRDKKQDQMDFSLGGTTNPWIMLKNYASNGQNRGTHHDKDFDALVDKFLHAKNIDEAKKWSVEADKYSLKQHWALRPGMLELFNVWQPYLKGYSGELGVLPGIASPGNMWTWYLARLWIDKD